MKINKIIYWTSPLLALGMYTSIIIILFSIEKGELYFGSSLPLFYMIIAPIIVTLGYTTTFLYQKMKYRKIILAPILLLFLLCEIIPAIKSYFIYDSTQNGAILIFIIDCLQSILIWLSYPLFLVILLYWSSRKERQKIKQTQQQTG